MNYPIQDFLSLVSFTHQIRNIKRAMWVKDEEVFENDSEHSYQLAMGLAMVHDVVSFGSVKVGSGI